MKWRKWPCPNGICGLLKQAYLKLFRINDTPQKIAQGFGIGVFTGIIPGLGPLAALSLAFIFKVNRASAFLGALLSNTWLSFLTFILSIKVGSVILGINWQQTYENTAALLKDKLWANLFKISIFKVILPVILGYLIIALCSALAVYFVVLTVMKKAKP